MMLSAKEVLEQSRAAFGQWKDKWESHAKINGEKYKKENRTHKELAGVGTGRTLLIVALGPSFEDNIGTIKENWQKPGLDIMCVDKAFHLLIKHGIKPKYVNIADAGISYDKWLKPWIEDTDGVTLISNVTANPEWSANWKGPVYYYVNKDNIKSEELFSKISGCKEAIPAASNVGNSNVVFAAQLMSYDKILLVGYDFCWGAEDKYYAFEDGNKRYWMNHMSLVDKIGRLVMTSQNLYFSARWLSDFYSGVCVPHGVRVYDCSKKGIANIPGAKLSTMLDMVNLRKATDQEKTNIIKARERTIKVNAKEGGDIKEHLRTLDITEVTINYLTKQDVQFLEAI